MFNELVFAQTAPQIISGRPGQAIGPRVVGKDIFQIQSGLDLNRAKTSFLEQNLRTSNNVVRFGLSEKFELSTVLDYSQTANDNNVTNFSENFEGVSQWQLGFRYNLIPRSDGWIPGFGIQTRFRLKQISDNYKADQIAPITMLVTNHSLSDNFSVNLNGGISYSGNNAIPRYLYIVSVGQNFGSSDFGAVYEFYGNEFNDQHSNYLGIGLSYLANDDLQFDLYTSHGKNQGVEEFYITLGLSWRTWVFGDKKVKM